MFTLNIISLMFTLVHVHLFSIVFYLRTLIGRLLALGGSGSLWVAMARSGWLWVAMGGYGSLWVIPVFSTTENLSIYQFQWRWWWSRIATRIRCAWGKFPKLLLLITSRRLSFKTRGRIYDT